MRIKLKTKPEDNAEKHCKLNKTNLVLVLFLSRNWHQVLVILMFVYKLQNDLDTTMFRA